ncbi:TIGR03084 family metal-binding protein [Actinokineospora sp. NPDC004072]
MTEQRDVFSDLTAEAEVLDGLLAGLDEAGWERPTPAPGWTVGHQVAHLSFIFRLAGLAATDAATFAAVTAPAAKDFEGAVNAALADYLPGPSSVLFSRWQDERDTAIKALAAVPGNQVVPWLVRPLPPAVLACAGFMELFGHGQDIADALGVRRPATDRLAHLCWFATAVWDFGYQSRGLPTPDVQFRWEITAPSGELWTFGPEDAEQRITGPAEDFCLLVTRRRHRDDLAMTAVGPDADQWLSIAQAYRGPAGPGRTPGQFAR